MNDNIIKCIDLKKSYYKRNSSFNILNKISFELQRGDIAGIIGESGSGKTTLLHLLAGLDTPTSGEILFNGRLFSSMSSNEMANFRNVELGFIYQFHHLLLDFNILENVSIPLLINNKSRKESEERAFNILKKVNLERKIKQYPSELSGGERQRVAVARAFVNNPAFIIADEPTGNLDAYNTKIILNLIFQLNCDFKTSFLIVTHDLNLIEKIPILFQMKNGQFFNYKN